MWLTQKYVPVLSGLTNVKFPYFLNDRCTTDPGFLLQFSKNSFLWPLTWFQGALDELAPGQWMPEGQNLLAPAPSAQDHRTNLWNLI
jgi:hypothetical protein